MRIALSLTSADTETPTILLPHLFASWIELASSTQRVSEPSRAPPHLPISDPVLGPPGGSYSAANSLSSVPQAPSARAATTAAIESFVMSAVISQVCLG